MTAPVVMPNAVANVGEIVPYSEKGSALSEMKRTLSAMALLSSASEIAILDWLGVFGVCASFPPETPLLFHMWHGVDR
jgi:hypothetical protein